MPLKALPRALVWQRLRRARLFLTVSSRNSDMPDEVSQVLSDYRSSSSQAIENERTGLWITQRAQYPLIEEYSLNHSMQPLIV